MSDSSFGRASYKKNDYVSYRKNGSAVDFNIVIPAGVNAVFTYADKEYTLTAGENAFTV